MKNVVRLLALCLTAMALPPIGWRLAEEASTHSSAPSCAPGFAGEFAWGGCFPDRIPAQILRNAPIPVVDPRSIVHQVTGLRFKGVLVAYLGSDDTDGSHPKGPLMGAGFVFGTPPHPGRTAQAHNATYVTVEEDGSESYRIQQYPQTVRGSGWWVYSGHFSRYRMEFQVSTDGTKQQVDSIGRAITELVHAQPVRPDPALRLYVQTPHGSVQSGQPATFIVLENGLAALQPAAFDLVLQGGWQQPKSEAAYSGGACGGDVAPWLTRRSRNVWNVEFGNCDEIELIVTPANSGFHSLRIRTYRLAIKPNGTIDQTHRTFVPHGGYEWEGQVL